ncbi:MAG: TolC family protein [Verrucomicrobia bacterium]|nr:TolC family protein [Verrucomicrobiota bacterium]
MGASFTLADIVPTAVAKNPDLMAARLAIDEAQGRQVQSGRLTNPELEVEVKPQVNLGGLGAQGVLAVGFTQRFPLTARLRLEKEVSRAVLAVARAEVRDAERRLAAEALTGAIGLLALDSQRNLKERQLTNSRELAAVSGKSATMGEGSGVEAAQFDLEAQELAVQRIQLETERAELVGSLRPLLGVVASDTIEIAGELSPARIAEATGEMPLASRPDYQAALARRETAERALALARANRWQDIGVGVFGELQRQEDDPLGVVNDNFVGLRISLPLPFWNRNQGRIQESAATVQRAERESEALAVRIHSEVEAAQRQMATTARLDMEVSGTLLPNAAKLEERLETLRSEGQATLTEVLRARERRFRMESIRLDARRDFHRARVRLEAATGMIVPESHVR